MARMHRVALTISLLLASAPAGAQTSLTGMWAITIGTPENPEYRTLDAVVAANGSISGTLGSPNGAVSIQTGRVAGSHFTLEATLGTGLRLYYDGVVAHDTIRGTWRYDKYEGRFIGVRGTNPPRAETASAIRNRSASVDAALRAATIDSLAKEIANRYVDTARVRRVVATLRERLRGGAYDTLTTAESFAHGVTDDLRRFDKHFAVLPATTNGMPAIGAGSSDNYAIKRVERLDGNVGYLKIDMFSVDSAGAAPVLQAALSFLARTEALILDLRDNRGGGSAVAQFLFSHLATGSARVIADVSTRTPRGFDSTTISAASVDSALGYGARPVYVLTSARTASAAEWLAYHLQSAKRARVVGEVSAGAAHPIRFLRLNPMFDATIPIARVRSRITSTDFEGVGVQPDVKATAASAFSAAYAESLRTLLSRVAGGPARIELERALAQQMAARSGPSGH